MAEVVKNPPEWGVGGVGKGTSFVPSVSTRRWVWLPVGRCGSWLGGRGAAPVDLGGRGAAVFVDLAP